MHDVIDLAIKTNSTEMCGELLKEGSTLACLTGTSIVFQISRMKFL